MNSSTARNALLAIGTAELLSAIGRYSRRKTLYTEAETRATLTNRKLVVIGDPDTGIHTRIKRAYGCGDLCIDLTGCPNCPNGVSLDITKQQAPVADDSAVVFISCVLEYVSDLKPAWEEILRMAGSKSNIFMSVVEPWTLTAALYPGANRTLTESGENEVRISCTRKILTMGVLGYLVWANLQRGSSISFIDTGLS